MFYPQRYLNDDSLPDPFEVIFGFGRRLDHRSFFLTILGSSSDMRWGVSRICPGRHLAEASYWGIASSMIAAFDISKALDSNGREINIPLEFTHGFVRYGFLFLLNCNNVFHLTNCLCYLAILNPSSVPLRPDPPNWLVLSATREKSSTCNDGL